jgi:hypothetical protein
VLTADGSPAASARERRAMLVTHGSVRTIRPGTVLPMLGVCVVGLFGFVALAVDLGMLAVARTQCQNAADIAALAGTRTLNNNSTNNYSNLPAAVVVAQTAATSNSLLSANVTAAQVSAVEAGQYLYDPTTQSFGVSAWTNVTGGGAVNPPSGSWTAMRVTLAVDQPTYFMRVFGVTSMPSGAQATAVFRPRDVAFVLDMTGSMKYSSTFNSGNLTTTNNYQSLNPDPMVPSYGHYVGNQTYLIATQNLVDGSGEAFPRNNYTISTPAGPPLIRNFYFDPTNLSTPSTPAYPLSTTGAGTPNLINAFQRWNPPQTNPGNSDTYTAPTYDFTGYNANNNGTEANPKGPVPAPDTFGSMTDGVATYVGDRARRRTGAIDKSTTDWTAGTNQAAYHAADLLGYASQPTGSPAFAAGWLNFRDPVWETYGYDLDVAKYRSARGSGGPLDPAAYLASSGGSTANILLPTADRFVGYSMGPGYWGKTFFMWPPDPRYGGGTGTPNPTGLNPSNPVQDTAGNWLCDWRQRFFFNTSGGALNTQGDNRPGTAPVDPINPVILSTNTGQTISAATYTTASGTTQVNYAAVLRWLKTGPQTLPPNLRAGRVLFYSSIPDDVNFATGSDQQVLDKAFWKNYIDFVLGVGSYTGFGNLYGGADSWSASPASISTAPLSGYQFPWESSPRLPYMRYTDSPYRPRLHIWFGPLSMANFITSVNGYNWNPGTSYEAHNWQLKAGMNSVVTDVQNNHPNDYAGLVYFSSTYLGVRVGLGQNYTALQNALFYPQSLYSQVNSGNFTAELRPYTNTSLTGYTAGDIPNAGGSTDPDTGLAYAFNLLSPSTVTAAVSAGTGAGRRGAQKIVIFETDGVPNAYRALTFNQLGYNSYYTTGAPNVAANGDPTSMSQAYSVIQQMTTQMASTATTSGTGANSGLSLPNAPARVYPIAFGDMFDPNIAPNATFAPTALQFLANCAYYGNTGPSGATTLPSTQIITGTYTTRITNLRNCMQQIFQSGVSVALIQ